ncbi:hypothetical protein LMG28688_00716 [Paraburkholderia caffeinitolerans]|uniref:Lipoprotein n=1 Tax=Paraburkholderia caffeinitolerans TaxID=1723730 RepID=A0A6J5FJ53_9BURK|nr:MULTISPECIES: hypothetical protein [Paraburkholderia]CAB3779091.1 hypothetical protein LMG28688_00716 [Paraburkholderia caffeinitolerans]
MKRFRIVFACLLCLTMAAVSGSVTACGDMNSGGGSSTSSSGGSSGGGGY